MFSCGFCKVDYDFIGKVETFRADTARVFLEANLVDTIDEWEVFGNFNPRTSFSATSFINSLSSSELTHHYFSMLTREQKEALYKVYEVDFEMFDYSADEYMD